MSARSMLAAALVFLRDVAAVLSNVGNEKLVVPVYDILS